MAAIVWQNVLDLPGTTTDGMATVPVAGQTAILAVVNSQLDVSMFDGEAGSITFLARCFLAAHYAAMSYQGSNGSVASQSEGGVSESFSRPLNMSLLSLTSYGVAFQTLIGSQAHGAFVL